jgi:hypothetical protein
LELLSHTSLPLVPQPLDDFALPLFMAHFRPNLQLTMHFPQTPTEQKLRLLIWIPPVQWRPWACEARTSFSTFFDVVTIVCRVPVFPQRGLSRVLITLIGMAVDGSLTSPVCVVASATPPFGSRRFCNQQRRKRKLTGKRSRRRQVCGLRLLTAASWSQFGWSSRRRYFHRHIIPLGSRRQVVVLRRFDLLFCSIWSAQSTIFRITPVIVVRCFARQDIAVAVIVPYYVTGVRDGVLSNKKLQ